MAAKYAIAIALASMLSACGDVLLAPTPDPHIAPVRSVEEADRTLAQATLDRNAIEAAFARSESDCYTRFFVTSCLEKARDQRRLSLSGVRAREVDAERFKRQASVEQRDRELAQANADFEREAAARAANPKPPREVIPDEEAPPSGIVNPVDRVAQHESRVKKQVAKDKAEAARRAEKADAFERKRIESEKRQAEVARKKAEKEKTEN